MKLQVLGAASLLTATLALSQQNPSTRTADGHPDLSGIWTNVLALPGENLVKILDGKVIRTPSRSGPRPRPTEIAGALPSDSAPSYKPEFQEKVKYLSENESKLDPVFYCDKPGTPRIGPPRKIVQLPKETIFLYEEMSGDTFRIIPTDGRGHRTRANPSAYGDSIGHWEKDVFVIESTNFLEDGWFGEQGYMHSDKMRVTERLWLTPENNLAYQATVEDPGVLTKPWTNFARVITPSNDPLEESPACKEDDGKRLLNLDHHLQR